MKYLYSALIICFCTLFAQAQRYDYAIGLRSGPYTNLSIKKSLNAYSAAEGIISFRPRGFKATGLMEQQRTIWGDDQLVAYYGFGGHLGLWEGSGNFDAFGYDHASYSLGLDAIAGLEYNFRNLPFQISFDYKPELNLLSNQGFFFTPSAFTVRYLF